MTVTAIAPAAEPQYSRAKFWLIRTTGRFCWRSTHSYSRRIECNGLLDLRQSLGPLLLLQGRLVGVEVSLRLQYRFGGQRA